MFAPVYRQLTLLELAGGILTGTSPDPSVGFGDVEKAFADYWAHDNVDPVTGERRGVVLIGHSQGTAALSALMRSTFDGDAGMRRQLVAAYLLGGDVQVPVDGVRVDWLQVEGDLSLFATDSRTNALGLHVADVNVALGDLTALADEQIAEWRSR